MTDPRPEPPVANEKLFGWPSQSLSRQTTGQFIPDRREHHSSIHTPISSSLPLSPSRVEDDPLSTLCGKINHVNLVVMRAPMLGFVVGRETWTDWRIWGRDAGTDALNAMPSRDSGSGSIDSLWPPCPGKA
jgi:hypothetical protein